MSVTPGREGAPSRLVIPRAAAETMLGHAARTWPDECCGLLVGVPGRVERAVPGRNMVASPTRYRLDPVDHFATIRAARREGLSVVGAYHSHPNGPLEPSETDRREAWADDCLVVIVVPAVSERAGALGAFRLQPEGVTRVMVEVR